MGKNDIKETQSDFVWSKIANRVPCSISGIWNMGYGTVSHIIMVERGSCEGCIWEFRSLI